MNDEIKEILDKLKDTADTSFFAICGTKEELENMPKSISKVLNITDKHAKLLLDYITNLQQELEKLNDDKRGMLAQLYKANDDRDKVKQENERLKKKNKEIYDGFKASIEELGDTCTELEDYKSRCEKASEYIDKQKKKMYKSRNKIALFVLMKLENILQNGSDSQ